MKGNNIYGGNFFSYPSSVEDVEGYNDAGILADEDTWEFNSVSDTTGITFEKATTNMQHTEFSGLNKLRSMYRRRS